MIRKVSGVTLSVSDMARSVRFYRDILELNMLYGGENTSFTSFDIDGTFLNLQLRLKTEVEWGRLILYCQDVDKVYSHLLKEGYNPPVPKDASWNERYFHLKDPDGHEISFAQPLKQR